MKEEISKARARYLKSKAAILSDPESKEIYDQTVTAYQVAKELAKARKKAKISQKQLAIKMHTTQSEISRIESGSNMSVDLIERYVSACGKKLQIKVV